MGQAVNIQADERSVRKKKCGKFQDFTFFARVWARAVEKDERAAQRERQSDHKEPFAPKPQRQRVNHAPERERERERERTVSLSSSSCRPT